MTTKGLEKAENRLKQGVEWLGRDNPDHGVIINRETCIAKQGCRNCINFCPGDLFKLEENKPVVKFMDECWYCGICASVCGPRAISYIFPKEISERTFGKATK